MRFRRGFLVLAFLIVALTLSAQNYVTIYSGNGSAGIQNGAISIATFNHPFGLCIDRENNLYIADADNNCIRKINITTGLVSTYAGTGVAGWKDGPSDSAKFNSPSDLCVDDSGNIYISDFLNQRIRKISITGTVSSIAGSGIAGFADGNSATAKFNYPRGICRDTNGNLYIGDSWNHRVRKIDVLGNVTTYAGGGTTIGVGSIGGLVDAGDTSARFYTPSGLAIDQYGNIFVADAYNHRVRKINTTQVVTTLAGSGTTGPGNGGYLNGNSSIARLNTPTEIFVDTGSGMLYISDTFNNRIRTVDMTNGMVTTYAGSGTAAFNDSLDTLATFNYPRGIVSDSSRHNLYVADYNNHSIRLIAPHNSAGFNEFISVGDGIIFRNPSSGIISFSGLPENIERLEIFNTPGIKIKELITAHENNILVDLSLFESGIYFLKFSSSSGKSIIKKLVLE